MRMNIFSSIFLIELGNKAIAEVLLDHGANKDEVDNSGNSILHVASIAGKMHRFFIASLNSHNSVSIFIEQGDLVELLVNRGANVNIIDR